MSDRRLLAARRAQHHEAVNAILAMGGYEKQYKMLSLVLEKLFSVCLFFEPTCAHARWALMHHFPSVCLSVSKTQTRKKS